MPVRAVQKSVTQGPRRAVGYFRVSSVPQADEERFSLPAQRERFNAYCLAHDLLPAHTYTDVMSGRRDDREQYRAMLQAARAGQFDCVIVQYLDRFGRDTEEILFRVLELQREYGIQVACTDESVESLVHLFLSSWKAGEEVKRLAQRTREGQRRFVQRHGRLIGAPPYGFQLSADRRQLEIEEAESAVIRLMAHLALDENLSMHQIAEHLNTRGYRRRSGGLWIGARVHQILLRPITTGTITYGVKGQKPDAFERAGAVPVILDGETMAALTERLQRRRSGQKSHSLTSLFLLSGLLRCGKCGNRMSGLRFKTETRYYRCRHVFAGQGICITNTQNAHKLEAAVLQLLAEQAHSDFITMQEATPGQGFEQERTDIRAQLHEIEAQFLRSFEAWSKGLLADESQYALANRRLKERQAALHARIADLDQREGQAVREARQREQMPEHLITFLETFETLTIQQQKAELATFIERITVWPNHEFTVVIRGFDSIGTDPVARYP